MAELVAGHMDIQWGYIYALVPRQILFLFPPHCNVVLFYHNKGKIQMCTLAGASPSHGPGVCNELWHNYFDYACRRMCTGLLLLVSRSAQGKFVLVLGGRCRWLGRWVRVEQGCFGVGRGQQRVEVEQAWDGVGTSLWQIDQILTPHPSTQALIGLSSISILQCCSCPSILYTWVVQAPGIHIVTWCWPCTARLELGCNSAQIWVLWYTISQMYACLIRWEIYSTELVC